MDCSPSGVVGRSWPSPAFSLLVAAVIGGGGVFGKLKGGGFEDPAAESTKARIYLDERLGAGDPNIVLVVTTPAVSMT